MGRITRNKRWSNMESCWVEENSLKKTLAVIWLLSSVWILRVEQTQGKNIWWVKRIWTAMSKMSDHFQWKYYQWAM